MSLTERYLFKSKRVNKSTLAYLRKLSNSREFFNAEWEYKLKKEVQKGYNKDNRCLMHEWKKHGCCICGYNKCDRALQFHHVVPKEKSFGLTVGVLSHPTERVVKEFYKCMLLCTNCHMEIHDKECL